MGRPEQPLPYPDRPLGRLAQALRNARVRADFTFSELADEVVGFSESTLKRAASGKTLPTRETVTAYARACNTEPGPLLNLWEAAVEERRPLRPAVPRVTKIRDAAALGAALHSLHVGAGSLSCREIEKRTRNSPGIIRVPRTTAHQILYRQRFPSSRTQLTALLTVLGVPAVEHAGWLQAWSRANRQRPSDRHAARTRKDQLQRRITQPRVPAPFDNTTSGNGTTPPDAS
ncbi:multiprotein-bridging factor 1 family protein [Streptomyces sp. NPDC001903]|uniref:helix-turn-helix domain-containing protein n=1 Tax=unclassified Streptomyces TaxID=2593676 RepID=UPI0036B682B1